MKCKDCKFYKPYPYDEQPGMGDCKNTLVRGESGLIKLVYCEDFYISENFGCIYAEQKTKIEEQ